VARLGAAQSRVRITTPAAHVDPRKKAGRGLGKRPDPFAVFAYNGMNALLAAVDRAGERGAVTRDSVREAVFDGSIQHGLSGQWQITDRGDSVYGVYDIVRAAQGRTVTPIDRLSDQLVRRARAKQTGARGAARATVPQATERSTVPMFGTAELLANTLDSMDLETALLAVQQQRAQLLDAQLAGQLADIQNGNRQIARLNDLLASLDGTLARFPMDARAGARLDSTGGAATYADPVGRVRAAESAAGLTLELPQDAAAWTKGQIQTSVETVKARIDQLGNSQQLDMLRLQSLTNKRNEAFAVMAEFVRKMQQSRSGIIP
jgi:hypothetical protein